jgi:hypothetical protein
VKQGLFITKHLEGNFVENRDGGSLRYISGEGEDKVIHPIMRSAWFMDSGFGKKIEIPALPTDTDVPPTTPNAEAFNF